MRDYSVGAVERLHRKLAGKLKNNVAKLAYTTGYFDEANRLECLQEMNILFYQHFEEYYEDDKQYLSFLFICMKNRMRNFQRRDIKHSNRYSTNLEMNRKQLGIYSPLDSSTDGYGSVWGQVEDPYNEWDKLEIAEIMENAKSAMDVQQREMFTLIVEEGALVEEIGEVCKLRKVINPTPPQKSRLTVLEKREGLNGLSLKETVDFVETSLRSSIVSNKKLDGLFA